MPYATFDNTYARLPERFHARLDPTPVARPQLIQYNDALAAELGLDRLAVDDATLTAIHAGNLVPQGAEPLSAAYAGHQFGGFVPQLGDGRAILLGEVIDRAGRHRDLQLKGSGPTPFSRNGDGRAALGPVLREFLVSEAMHALGIPTTRALAAVTSGEPVYREAVLPGAVLTRVASSHVRVGTFQYFAARADVAAVRILADHVIERHDPAARQAERPYLALLAAVAERQADLVARWMMVGFVHGVMNTDNMAICGETIDFGPCAFLEAYDPAAVFSSIDRGGRYAYANQAPAAQWNLARLAEALLPLIDPDPAIAADLARAVLTQFGASFERAWLSGMRRKLGLLEAHADDAALIERLLEAMHAEEVDFTLAFRRLCAVAQAPAQDAPAAGLRELFADPAGLDRWLADWRRRIGAEAPDAAARVRRMRAANPAFIPRNHRVEQAIDAATRDGDFAPFERLLGVLAHPYDDQAANIEYERPARPGERVDRTYCGT